MSVTALLPFDRAQTRLLELAVPLAAETLPLEAAHGRFLAQSLAARRTQPAADLSAMDGFAVRGDELQGPWQVIGESAAGHPFTGKLGEGEAIRISTGALMPDGGGAVLIKEHAVLDGNVLRLSADNKATPQYIRRRGFDFGEGDTLIEAGVRLGPARIALAIAGGHKDIMVHQRPRLAILDTGDELAADPCQASGHQIPSSNGPMLAAMSAPFVGNCLRLGPIPDKQQAIIAALDDVAACDVIVTSGGASVGDHDLLRPALEDWGAKITFWRIAMKPGKPLLVARKDRTIILGLPGNPASSYVTAYLFLLPLLRRLSGAVDALPRAVRMPLGAAIRATGSRTEFVRGTIRSGTIHPIDERDSSALLALSRAEVLVRRDDNAPAAPEGECVETYLLENGGIA